MASFQNEVQKFPFMIMNTSRDGLIKRHMQHQAIDSRIAREFQIRGISHYCARDDQMSLKYRLAENMSKPGSVNHPCLLMCECSPLLEIFFGHASLAIIS
jgi:hypothetical protein